MDLEGKKNDWEGVVLIPFIDEKALLQAMAPKEKHLSKEDLQRNTHGKALVYTYDPSFTTSLVPPNEEIFASIPDSHSKEAPFVLAEIPPSGIGFRGLLEKVDVSSAFE